MTARPFITCRELIDFIAGYLEHALPPHDEQDFERHLAACPSCRAYLATYQAAIRLGKAAYESDPVEAAPEELIQAVLKVQKRHG